ncbi:ankyrin repeat-containing domain protein [Entophlyctis helioformis]|nr:ankyrin repeat-containing domain protein [Entophlyctis helioformis]
MTLLHWAADRDYTDLARLLLDSGAQIDVQDDNGQTALHYAAIVESADMVRLLVGRGARPDIADHDGATPAELAPSLMRLPSLE